MVGSTRSLQKAVDPYLIKDVKTIIIDRLGVAPEISSRSPIETVPQAPARASEQRLLESKGSRARKWQSKPQRSPSVETPMIPLLFSSIARELAIAKPKCRTLPSHSSSRREASRSSRARGD
jgi:hypothetical protein